MRRKRNLWLFGAALVFVSCAARLCAATRSRLTIRRERFVAASGATAEAEYGELAVPANRSRPGAPSISLAFVRFPATAPHAGSPIVYLAGGPGTSGIEAARGDRFPIFQALRAFGDVIALDQRGTGKSRPSLRCAEQYQIPLDRPLDRVGAAAAIAEAMKPCRARLEGEGVDLADYNTRESAADVNDLRIALGAGKMTLWGISYGTHLALATLREYEPFVDRVILAGIEPLHHTEKLPSDPQALLEDLARRAREDPAVRAAVPDLLAAIGEIERKLEADPARVSLADPRSGRAAELVLGRLDFQFALSQMIGDAEGIAAVPDFVSRVANGDTVALGLAAASGRIGRVPNLMSLAMDCASGADEKWRERIRVEAPGTLLGDAINIPVPDICKAVGVPDLGPDFRRPVESKVPALLISGTLDGRTPIRNAREIMPGLPNGRLLVIEDAAHSDPLFLASPRILEAMKDFLRGGEPQDSRIAGKPFRFVAPRSVVALTAGSLERYVGRYRIEGGGERRVVKAGSLLFTIRDSGSPLAIRPSSEAAFFYEGRSARLAFEIGRDGKVQGMVMYQAEGEKPERAKKVD